MTSVESRNFYPALTRHVTPTESGSTVVSYTSDRGPDSLILILIHGYPQSAFIWRHIVPHLLGKVSLFIPELPGYGISTPCSEHSKLDIGLALLEALRATFHVDSSKPRKVVVGGHDRGARVAHRLAVSAGAGDARVAGKGVVVVGAALLDIVPTKVQWEAFASPAASKAYFHWPLLANVELAVPLLRAFGGGKWARFGNMKLAGSNEEGVKRLTSDGAVDVYAALFEKEETLRCTCEDYAASAGADFEREVEDQKAGRKIKVPTLVMFSAGNQGKRIDIAGVWKDWIDEGVAYEAVAVGDGYGHFLPEEAADVVSDHIAKYLDRVL